MKNKITTLVIAIILPFATVASDSFNAKTNAMGGVGVASGNFTSAGLYNPALASKAKWSDDVNINFNVGVLVADEDKFVDSFDTVQNLSNAYTSKNNNSTVRTQADADELKRELIALDGKVLRADMGGNFTIAIPTKSVSTGLYVNNYTRIGGFFKYNTVDSVAIDAAVGGGTDPTYKLSSEGRMFGAAVTEVGIVLSNSYGGGKVDGLSVGITPKYQRVDVFSYTANVDSFDDTDFNESQYTTDDSNFNVDFGLYKPWVLSETSNASVGLVGKNLVSETYFGIDGAKVEIEPLYTLGGAYENSWFLGSIDIDLNKDNNLGLFKSSQYVRGGMAFDAVDWAQLRVGYKHDMEGNYDDIYTAGIGISPFDVLNIDVAAVYGKNDVYGASVQFGLKF
jgi:hypothetical protein